MKKKLEAELISIAHRILQLKNKSDLDILHLETQKLYETLSVLKFAEKHFSDAKPTIGIQEIEDKLEAETTEIEQIQEQILIDQSVDADLSLNETSAESLEIDEEVLEEEEPIHDLIVEDDSVEENIEIEEEQEIVEETVTEEPEVEIEEDEVLEETHPAFNPGFELSFEKVEPMEPEIPSKEIVFEDIFGDHFKDLEFVKAESFEVVEDQVESQIESQVEQEIEEQEIEEDEVVEEVQQEVISHDFSSFVKPEIATEIPAANAEEIKNTKAITFGLNDRIGFVSQLFDGSNEDFNRVLSQLNTFHKFEDAKNFIEDLVKPDYNDWSGKEDFEKRFYEVVENKFK